MDTGKLSDVSFHKFCKLICSKLQETYVHEEREMTDTQSRGLKFAYFVLGIALPVLGLSLWVKGRQTRKAEVDQAHDVTVEDSFPASDPPSSW